MADKRPREREKQERRMIDLAEPEWSRSVGARRRWLRPKARR